MAFFFSRLVIIILIKKLLSMRTVLSTISASENNDIENLFMFCYPMSVIQECGVQYFVVNSIGRVFCYNDVIMLVQIFSILLILFT